MNKVVQWVKQGHAEDMPPPLAMRPCDFQMMLAWQALETQLGTVEAYNRLCRIAYDAKKMIDSGNVKSQNPLFAKSVTGAQ